MLFAQSGGVMEAALRTAVEKITGEELGKWNLKWCGAKRELAARKLK